MSICWTLVKSVWERFYFWSPHLLAFAFGFCLFGYLMPGYSSSHGRGVHGRPGRHQGEALHCAADQLHLHLLLLRRVLAPQGEQQGAAKTNQQRSKFNSRAAPCPPLLSRLACPQIINPNAHAALTKPHLINVPPHKYKLYPLPACQLRCLFRSQYQQKIGWFC